MHKILSFNYINTPSRRLLYFAFSLLASLSFSGLKAQEGTLRVAFINTANTRAITLRDSLYKNPFGEPYSVSKLKYYVSNLNVMGNHPKNATESCYLVNAANEVNSFDILLKAGNYGDLEFLLGVDSLKNCSGAQTGALDPLNDMFWTWNTGYVIFKLEGTSSSSTADLNRIEYHIGGYKGNNNVSKKIILHTGAKNSLMINPGHITEVVIELNLDNFWKGSSDLHISALPTCMTTGEMAMKIASNFNTLFSIKSISNIP